MMQQTFPVISVIIPCYNYDAFLNDACNSLLAQSFKEWECILVNNGRFPKTKLIAEKFANEDNRFIYLESENAGPSTARNIGLKSAAGEFIQFLDADDKLAPERFRILIQIFAESPTIDLIYTGVKYFSTELPQTYIESLDELNSSGKRDHSGSGTVLYNLLLRKNIFAINSVMFRKSLISDSTLFNTDYKHLEDLDFWLRVSKNIRKFEYLANEITLAYVRSHTTSLSKDKRSMSGNYLPVVLSNIQLSRSSIVNLFVLYIICSERIVDGILKGLFLSDLRSVFSALKKTENYFLTTILYLLIPVYLPLYILLKIYRIISR